MASRSDRRALLLLLALGAAGAAVRLLTGPKGAPGAVGYRATPAPRSSLDSVAARAGRLARPLKRGETIDLDRASAEEITRLPRVGPALAGRIVADRDANGPFGSLEGLDRVSGIGPSVMREVKPYARFSGRVGGSSDRRFAGRGVLRSAEPPTRSGTGRQGQGAAPPVGLNTATEAELAQLPGIGPTRARAIVADRDRHGPYRSLEDLGRVRGIGRATLARLRGRVRVP